SSKWPRLWRAHQVWRDNRAGCPRGEKHSVQSPPRPEDHRAADQIATLARLTIRGVVPEQRTPVFATLLRIVWQLPQPKTDAAALHHAEKDLLFSGRVARPDERFEIGSIKAPVAPEQR